MIQGTFISELLDLRLRKVTVELLTGLLLRSLVAPSKEGPADIYIYISEGLRPLPPAPKLEDPMIGGLDDSMNG